MAATLCGSWRRLPLPLQVPVASIATILPALLEDGAGGLAWWRLCQSMTPLSRQVRVLRDAFRSQVLEAAHWEEHIGQVLNLLHSAGLDPLLIKGWASARLYAEPGMRPSSDIDLCLRPGEMPAAQAALKGSTLSTLVDLHTGIPDLPDRSMEEVLRRSRLVLLGEVEVRIPGPEDHLRLLCFHFARHSGCRPLWLCDVAAAVEALPTDFDWDYFQEGNLRVSDWVRCTVGLAGPLLGAQLPPPAAAWAARVPGWLERAVLWRWGAGYRRQPFAHYLRHPFEALQGLHYHGLNPLRGVFQLGLSPYTRWPVPLLQIGGWSVVALLRRHASRQAQRTPAVGPAPVHRPLALLALARYARRRQPVPPGAGQKPAPKKFLGRLAAWKGWAWKLLLFGLFVWLFRTVVADICYVPSGSMRPALLEGDRILVNRLAYGLRTPFRHAVLTTWACPQRGHVVVFPNPVDGKLYVKRVVGLPGDAIEVRDNQVFVNGEPDSNAPGQPVSPSPGPTLRVQVAPGHCFLLGDNRDHSFDSRYFGCVKQHCIAGRVVGVALSLDPANHYLPRWLRFGRGLD